MGGVILFALGIREFYALVCFSLCIFVTGTIGLEFFRGARVLSARSGSSFFTSIGDLTMRNTRRYGGYIVHMGMVLIFIGLAGAAFNRDVQKEMQLGSTMQIGPYSLLLQSTDSKAEKSYRQNAFVEVLVRIFMLLLPSASATIMLCGLMSRCTTPFA